MVFFHKVDIYLCVNTLSKDTEPVVYTSQKDKRSV